MEIVCFRGTAIGAFTIALSATLLVGCQRAPDQVVTDQVPAPAKHAAAHQRTTLDQRLSQGMAYADMRSLILGEGWLPVTDPQCAANVVGSEYQRTCSSDPALDVCTICKKLPELSGCSGDAYCGMYFSKDQQRLHVVAYGDMRDWNVGGDRSEFTVSSWDFAPN